MRAGLILVCLYISIADICGRRHQVIPGVGRTVLRPPGLGIISGRSSSQFSGLRTGNHNTQMTASSTHDLLREVRQMQAQVPPVAPKKLSNSRIVDTDLMSVLRRSSFSDGNSAELMPSLGQAGRLLGLTPLAEEGRGRRQRVQLQAASQTIEAVDIPELQNVTGEISEAEFWKLVDASEVEQAILVSWRGKELIAKRKGAGFLAVSDLSDVEDLRNRLLDTGVHFRYPSGDVLTEEEALEKQEYGSEGATAAGMLSAAVLTAIDAAEIELAAVLTDEVEVAGRLVIGGGIGGGGLVEGQALVEGNSPQQVLQEDIRLLEQAALSGEKIAEQELVKAEQSLVASGQWFQDGGAFSALDQWTRAVSRGLVENHAPGIGGVIEDSFMSLLVVVSLYSLYKQAIIKRKSSSLSGLAHTATGAMQIGVVLYAIIVERCLRASPGPTWAIVSFIIFMVNNVTMWPLLKYFRGPEVYRVLFKLAFSFIISFQGIHCIAFSIQYPWLYWLVMPFWFWSVKKLMESSDNIYALLPEGLGPLQSFQDAAKRRVKGIKNDTATLVYSILNFAGAVFDNLYMAAYTWRGPAGFWGWSEANIPVVNDHLRTALVKPAFGSLTISVLVFLGTLVYRKQMNDKIGIALNVILASIGPWLILYYHKLIDWDEPWQPEIAGDWGSRPYFWDHWPEGLSGLALPVAVAGAGKVAAMGFDALSDATALPAETVPAVADAADSSVSLGLSVDASQLPFDPLGLQRAE